MRNDFDADVDCVLTKEQLSKAVEINQKIRTAIAEIVEKKPKTVEEIDFPQTK